MSIEFIYFDLGNVLVEFDPARGCENVSRWAGVSAARVRAVVWESGLEERYERGEVSCEQFAAAVCDQLCIDSSPLDLLDLVSDMFTPNATILPVIQSLQQRGLPLGILSNTCHAHWDWIRRRRWPVASEWFQVAVLSYEIGCMKPAAAIYAEAAARAGVPPQSIFFTDDRVENVEAARRAGWQAFVYHDTAKLKGDLHACGVRGLGLAAPIGHSEG